MGTRVIEKEIVWKWKLELNNFKWTLWFGRHRVKVLAELCLSSKWNNKERKSLRRLLPVVFVGKSAFCCMKNTIIKGMQAFVRLAAARQLVCFENFSHRDFIFIQNYFYLPIANKNHKNSSFYVQTITNLSSNHHLSWHTLHKQVNQMFATRQPEKTSLGIEKFSWKSSFRKADMWRDNLRSTLAIMLRCEF